MTILKNKSKVMSAEGKVTIRQCPKCGRSFFISDDALAQASAQSKDWYCGYPGCSELATKKDEQERK